MPKYLHAVTSHKHDILRSTGKVRMHKERFIPTLFSYCNYIAPQRASCNILFARAGRYANLIAAIFISLLQIAADIRAFCLLNER